MKNRLHFLSAAAAATTAPTQLHFLDATADVAELPGKLPILKWGDNESVKGVYRVTERTLHSLAANQRRRGYDTIALDYEHNTVPGTPAYKESKEPRVVAGHGPVEVIEGVGIVLHVDYTDDGKVNAKNFKDVSACVEIDEVTREVLFVHSAGLCRNGAVYDLHFLSVDLPANVQAITMEALAAKLGEMESRLSYMDMLQKALEQAQKENAALKAAVEAMSEKLQAMSRPAPELETLSAAINPVAGQLQALGAKIDPVPARLEALSARLDEQDRALLVMRATAAGKVIPLSDDEIKRTPLHTLNAICDQLPAGQVPMRRNTSAVIPLGAGGEAAPHLAQIAKACGVPLASVMKTLANK